MAMPLGLLTPDPGVEATGMESADCSRPKSCGVRLVSSTRVPSRCSAVLIAQVDTNNNVSILFEPNVGLVKESGLQLDDALL